MEPFIAVLGFVFVAVITPGPNNFVVLTAAAHGGVAAALPAIAGVVVGSVALAALVWSGADAVFHVIPAAREALMVAGAIYLAWLGAQLIWHGGAKAVPTGSSAGPKSNVGPRAALRLPRTTVGLAAFQLLNPKSWVLVLTATTALLGAAEPISALTALIVMFTVVPLVCLMLWAALGAAISSTLERPRHRRLFDTAMGLVLIASALGLVL